MTTEQPRKKIEWYRPPIDPDTLRGLSRRSDLKGFAQALGHLGLLTLTGGAAVYASFQLPWPWLIPILFLHGTVYAFLTNGFHEFCHYTVFKTRWLNEFFLRVFAFLNMQNFHTFRASHGAHHQYTLYPPDDLEVVLPATFTRSDFLKHAVFSPINLVNHIRTLCRFSIGRMEGEWLIHLYPETDTVRRRQVFNFARMTLAGHALITGVSLWYGLWIIPLVVCCPHMYGAGLFQLCNSTQHIGLQDNVPDFRLNSRSVTLSPVVRFLYWHMNFHIEHHMFAAVPCYNLGKLHNLIKHNLPTPPNGLIACWKEISAIQERQKQDPNYQFTPTLPEPS